MVFPFPCNVMPALILSPFVFHSHFMNCPHPLLSFNCSCHFGVSLRVCKLLYQLSKYQTVTSLIEKGIGALSTTLFRKRGALLRVLRQIQLSPAEATELHF